MKAPRRTPGGREPRRQKTMAIKMNELTSYTREAQRLAAEFGKPNVTAPQSHDSKLREVRARLMESATRVLRERAAEELASDDAAGVSGANGEGQAPGDRLWDLTCAVTALSQRDNGAIDEAVASLQTLSCLFSESAVEVASRLDRLR